MSRSDPGSRIGTDGEKGTLRVTGIIEERGMSFRYQHRLVPLLLPRTGLTATYNRNDYDKVVVKVKNLDEIANVKIAIEKQMNKQGQGCRCHGQQGDLATIFQAFGQVTTFVSAIGGISMIVAGVSIFNIMMMSVTERIKEIGIMRSIGTQKKEVMCMFMYEAAILGVVGSIIGGLMSLLGGYAISSLMLKTTKYLFVPSNAMLHIVTGWRFGIVVCLICGIYPAWQAANLNPIDALRHE